MEGSRTALALLAHRTSPQVHHSHRGPKKSRRNSCRLCEALESVRVLKDYANLKYKEKQLEEAEKLYNEAILKLEESKHKIPASQKLETISLETSLLLNLSNIKMANKEYTALLNLAKEVVLMSPESGKGYFRYAQALFHLGKTEAAYDKIKQAAKYSQYSESNSS